MSMRSKTESKELKAELDNSLKAHLNIINRIELDLFKIYDDVTFGFCTIDLDQQILSINTQALKWLGNEDSNLIGSSFNQLLTPKSQRTLKNHFKIANNLGKPEDVLLEMVDGKGEVRCFYLQSRWLNNNQGNIVGMQLAFFENHNDAISSNITPTQSDAFESLEARIITDADCNILQANQAFTTITGYEASEIVGRKANFHHSKVINEPFHQSLRDELKLHKQWQGQLWIQHKSGELYLEEFSITAVTDDKEKATHFIATLIDSTKHQRQSKNIRNLAFYDSLTGLPNRILMTSRINDAITSNNHFNHFSALVFIDLDNFKEVNDTLGHDMGDLLLRHIASRIANNLRESDCIARFGGDEFVILIMNLSNDAHQAAKLSKSICNKILLFLNKKITLHDHELFITASMGIEIFGKRETTPHTLMKHADIAMYKAKKDGGNALCFFDQKMQSILNYRATLITELRHALVQNEFVLFYQQQVNKNGQIIGCEALIRWAHPKKGLIQPNDFIPLAEECGLIIKIGQWVLENACLQLKQWALKETTNHLPISINLSAKQLKMPNFVAEIQKTIEKHAINPKLIKLEITESMLIDNIEDSIQKILSLKKIGIDCELDDFGMGYSSLQYLKKLPIKQLKVEKLFVDGICSNKSDQGIIRIIIAIAETLNLNVIAEGVETEQQRQALLKMGCNRFQGFLFGKPMPIEAFNNKIFDKKNT